MSKIVLPGSEGEEGTTAGAGGRLGAEDVAALAQVAHWWRHRLARADAADPLESAFGGVDDSGAARTVGLAAVAVAFSRPLSVPPGGVALWLVALGVPEPPPAVSEVYSLVALAHFYPVAGGWTGRSVVVARAPAAPDTTELRAVLTGPPPGDTPAIQIVGVAGVNINWKVEVYRLERQ